MKSWYEQAVETASRMQAAEERGEQRLPHVLKPRLERLLAKLTLVEFEAFEARMCADFPSFARSLAKNREAQLDRK